MEAESKREKIKIGFQAGEGRDINGGVNYMINNENDLYAEIAVPDEPVDEEYGYFALKEAIIKQTAEKGIEKERLAFWYDGQEQYLSKAAKVGCEEVLVAKPKCRVIAAIIQILEHRTKCALVLV